jgi:hypothetical protein
MTCEYGQKKQTMYRVSIGIIAHEQGENNRLFEKRLMTVLAREVYGGKI